jgi:hypothetical protein
VWGEDAWEFRPDRWLEGLPPATEGVSGYKHLLTFLDGPKAWVYNLCGIEESLRRKSDVSGEILPL